MTFGGRHFSITLLSFFPITTLSVCVGLEVDFKKAITHHPVYSVSNVRPLCSPFSLLAEHSPTTVLSKVFQKEKQGEMIN